MMSCPCGSESVITWAIFMYLWGLFLRSLFREAEGFGRNPTSGYRAPLGRYDLCLRQGMGEFMSLYNPAYVTVKQGKSN